MAVIVRQLNPGPFTKYQSYKPYLRKEFLYRCAYCTLHEGDAGAGGVWHYCVEHFRPKKKFPELLCVYSNLYYACPFCNTTKNETWPSDKHIEQGFYFVDPCKEDLYVDHTEEQDDGRLTHKTNAGFYTIEHLLLNRRFFRKMRKDRREAQAKIAELLSLLTSLKQQSSINADSINAIAGQIVLLEQRYLNPLVPYEMEDQR